MFAIKKKLSGMDTLCLCNIPSLGGDMFYPLKKMLEIKKQKKHRAASLKLFSSQQEAQNFISEHSALCGQDNLICEVRVMMDGKLTIA